MYHKRKLYRRTCRDDMQRRESVYTGLTISFGRLMRTEDERFGPQNQVSTIWSRNWLFSRLFLWGISFRTATNRKQGSSFGQHPCPKLAPGFTWPWVFTYRGGQQASKYTENSSTEGAHISDNQATGPVLLAVSRYTPPRASQASPRAEGIGL